MSEYVCDNCEVTVHDTHLPLGWRYDGPGCGAVICPDCWLEHCAARRELMELGTIGPQDPTP